MDSTPATSGLWQRVTDTPCAQGASPFWNAKEDRLYWVDTALRCLWRLHTPSGQAESWDLTQEPSSVAPCRSGNLLIALRDGLYSSTTWGDIPQTVAKAPFDTAHTRFGPGVCDPWGRFWVGTVSDGIAAGGLYCLHTRNKPQPELQLVERPVRESCGLAWSADARRLYWGDTARHGVETLALSQAGQWPPSLGGPLPYADWPGDRPGGAAVDKAGNYWIALQNSGRVVCLNPNGDTLAEYPTPAQHPTALCFGGKDLCTLYLTTARAGSNAAELAQHPDSGQVFALRVTTPGLPANLYWD